MIKLGKILSEIKIVKEITQDMIEDLWDKMLDPNNDVPYEARQRIRVKYHDKDWGFRFITKGLAKERYKELYRDLQSELQGKPINEIKIITNPTIEMVDKEYTRIAKGSPEGVGGLWGLAMDYLEELVPDSPKNHSIYQDLQKLNQKQLKELYLKLKKLK